MASTPNKQATPNAKKSENCIPPFSHMRNRFRRAYAISMPKRLRTSLLEFQTEPTTEKSQGSGDRVPRVNKLLPNHSFRPFRSSHVRSFVGLMSPPSTSARTYSANRVSQSLFSLDGLDRQPRLPVRRRKSFLPAERLAITLQLGQGPPSGFRQVASHCHGRLLMVLRTFHSLIQPHNVRSR